MAARKRERKPTPLGDRVREMRELRGFSQRELSRRAKLDSEDHVRHVELGFIRDPGVDTVLRIAEALRARPEYLLVGILPREPQPNAPSAPRAASASDANRDALATELEGQGCDARLVARLREQPPRPEWRMRDWVAWVDELRDGRAHLMAAQRSAEQSERGVLIDHLVTLLPGRWSEAAVATARSAAARWDRGAFTEDDARDLLDGAAASARGKRVTRPVPEELSERPGRRR